MVWFTTFFIAKDTVSYSRFPYEAAEKGWALAFNTEMPATWHPSSEVEDPLIAVDALFSQQTVRGKLNFKATL